ncbi:MAG: SAM-dependent chlorinase/fluorinase, partial [Planctomycetota bacterium]
MTQSGVEPSAIVTFTTDFGEGSRYVGEMKGALLAVNPLANLIDLTHSVPPQDIATASRWLADAAFAFPAGTLHVAVIDPGVGSSRQIVYAEFGEQRFICPNNGLLTDLADRANLAERAPAGKIFSIEERRFWRSRVSATFHGRDIMAPVAGHLTRGARPDELGRRLTAADVVR